MKILIQNKKGTIAEEVILYIPRIIFLIAVIFAFVLLVKTLLVTTIDIREVESKVLVSRFLLSTNTSTYYDSDLERNYPGIIDLQKFVALGAYDDKGRNTLDSYSMTYEESNPIIAAKITLRLEGVRDISIFYNRERYDRWEPRARSAVTGGSGSFKSFNHTQLVLVNNDGALQVGQLEVYSIG